jgi:hypothetical protein
MKKIEILLFFITTPFLVFSQNEADLAKATQNPVSDLISLPFQNNTTYGNGPFNRPQNVLNIQPVLPFGIGDKITMINRVIAPIITQPSTTEDKSTTGLGDINYTAWFSPKESGKLIYGVGPVLQFPTATKTELGSKEFGVGPSIVALTMINKWVAGIVVNNIWTFGDISENKFLFQYFVNYNLPKAWYLVTAPIMTANWNAADGQQWIIPFGAGVGKVFKIGKQPMNLNAQVYYNAVTPTGVGEWQSRIQLQFLFPKKPKE